jgi:TonB-linked SusC/RagA family outer membrane protein
MRTKLNGILTLFLVLLVQITFAQTETVTGTVTDPDGLPLPGVNVLIKGQGTGTQTDFDGNFSIQANSSDKLIFSYIGFDKQTISVGTKTNINVKLEIGESLDEVVVTALGIERSARSLGYGVSSVKAQDLNEVRANDALEGLKGKASGLVITNQSGNVGGSQRILIRGVSSLQGGVQPLFVVDGVPISNDNIASGSRITGGFDFGNRAQDINPDDIESITVLKGASAAALYGSRAANGVIQITTKKGKAGKKASFQINQSSRFDTPLILPDFQNEYVFGDEGEVILGDGESIVDGGFGFEGWGPNISNVRDQTYVGYGGEEVPYEIFNNNVEDFYQTAVVNVTSFSASGASEEGKDDYRLSLSYQDQEGNIPASSLNRTNLSFNAGSEFNEKLKSRVVLNYVRSNIRGSAAQGANDPNVLSNLINGLPRTADTNIFRDFRDDQGNQINTIGTQVNNPYWIANANRNENTVQRFFGNAQLEWKPIKRFSILARSGYDTYTDTRFTRNSIGTLGRADGSYRDDLLNVRQLTLDLIANYNLDITEDLNLEINAGTQWNERVFERTGNNATVLTVPGLYSPGNAGNNAPFKDFSERRIHGVFGDITLSYKNWAFLNATGRNDWSSTLPVQNRSFFYPSISGSIVWTDALNIESSWLNYGKVRGSWANVGVDTGAYLLDFQYFPDTGFFGQFGTGGTFPFNDNLAFNSSGELPNANLKPENQGNFEVGLEFGFFNNRIILDATYYKNETTDQILSLPTPQTSGFGSFRTNIGQISNEGFELELTSTVVQTDNFSWQLNGNFSTNEFVVDDLGDIPALNLATGFNDIGVRAIEGESLNLFGPGFLRNTDANGDPIDDQILVNEDGLRQVGESRAFGDIFPDFVMGLTSIFRYKGFSLRGTFDYREGGVVFSNTVGLLRRAGLAEETALNGRANLVDTGTFVLDSNGDAVPNTTEITSQQYWQNFANASVAEGNIFDGTFIKLREVSLTYDFPRNLLEKTFISALQVGIQGRNLAVFNTDVPHIDPEASLGGSGSSLQGIERGSIPVPRSVGMNLKMSF